jgi:arginase
MNQVDAVASDRPDAERPQSVAVLGAALDLGTARRGVDMGPSAIRYSGLAERLEMMGVDVVDGGNVATTMPEIASIRDESARYLPAILATCSQLAERVVEYTTEGHFPLVLGGDHSIAMGTLAGLHKARGTGGVIWVDAHGDANTPDTTPTGNVHGMPLAAALGECGFDIEGFEPPPWIDASRVALVGIRQLDEGEKQLARKLGLHVLTMAEIDRRGIAAVMHRALDIAAGPNFLHLSFDMDSLDPEIAPGVGTPVRGGLSYREAHLAMELAAESRQLTSMEIVEVNPILDHANATGGLAVELVASALGARII